MRRLASLLVVCGYLVGGRAAAEPRFVLQAQVLLPEPRVASGADIVEAYAGFAPKQSLRPVEGRDKPPGAQQVLRFQVGARGTAVVVLVPTPLSDKEIEETARQSVSPLGGNTVGPHKARLTVVLNEAAGANRIEVLSRFTALLAALAISSQGVGVHWPAAGATHEANFFLGAARNSSLVPRIMLWSGVRIVGEEGDRLTLLSLGMSQLDLPDLLVTTGADRGLSKMTVFYELLAEAARRGKPIREGGTIGRTPGERLTVHYVPSPIDARKKVWRVELP